MRSSVTTGLAIACVALTAGIVYIGHELSDERERSESESQARQAAENKLRALEARLNAFPRRRELERGIESAPAAVSQSQVASANNAPVGNYSSGFANTSDQTQAQPRPPLERGRPVPPRRNAQIKLVESLKLSAADGAKVLQALTEEQEKLIKVLSANEGQPPDQQAVAALQAEADQRLRDLLGEDKYREYQEYRRYEPQHEQVNMLNNRLANVTGNALTPQQESSLFNVLKEERDRVPAPAVSQYATRPEFIAAMNDWRTGYTQRTQERAATILTPEQVPVFQSMRNFGGPPRGNRP